MDEDSDGGASSSTLEISQPATQFVPQEDDAEILWEVVEITAEKEKSKLYRVRWAGTDPKTRKPWPQSWVPMHDCTDDLVLAWKRKQALKKKEAERKKSAKRVSANTKQSRGSAMSRSSAVNSNAVSAGSSATKSHTRLNATTTPTAGLSNAKSLFRSPSKLASTSILKSSAVNSNGKRKRSLPAHTPSDDEFSLPEIATLTKARPEKKRKLNDDSIASPAHEPEISQESHEVSQANAPRRRRVLIVKEQEEEESEEEEEQVRNKSESSRAQTRSKDQTKKQLPSRPRLDKGKGRALPSPSSSKSDQEQEDRRTSPPPRPRATAAPPSQPSSKELEERKALAIAKKKSQLAQAGIPIREPSVNPQPTAIKRASSSKSVAKSTFSAKKPVASASTGGTKETKRKMVDSDRDDDDDRVAADADMPPLRKKSAPHQAVPAPAKGRAVQGPRVDLRVPSASSSASKPKSKSKSKPELKLVQTPVTENASVPEPLLSPHAQAQLEEFDKWVTESARKAREAGIAIHAPEKEKEKEKEDELPVHSSLNTFIEGGDDSHVEFMGNMVDDPALQRPSSQTSRMSPMPPTSQRQTDPSNPSQSQPPLPRSRSHSPIQIGRTRTSSSGPAHSPERDNSYRQGVVPETETETSNNTQSQSQSQSQTDQLQPQLQALKLPIDSSPVPTLTNPETSLVDIGADKDVKAAGRGRGLRRNGTEAVVVTAEDSGKKKPVQTEATLPDLIPTTNVNARASGSGSGSGLQKNGTMTPKLVSRMKPRTPGSMAKLGMGGIGIGKAPLLSFVLEDEDRLYLPHDDVFQRVELVQDHGDGGMNVDMPASPLQEMPKPASATAMMTQDNNTSGSKDQAKTTKNHDNSRPPTSPPSIATNKPLRPIPLLSPSTFTPLIPLTSSISNVDVEGDGDGMGDGEEREVEELMSSIEQFSSPEKGKRKPKMKRVGRLRSVGQVKKGGGKGIRVGGDVDTDEDEDEFLATVHQRGIEMAEQVRGMRVRRDQEEGRRVSKTKIFDMSKGSEKRLEIRGEPEEESAQANGEEKEMEARSDKDKDNSGWRPDKGWLSAALRTWPLGNRGNGTVASGPANAQMESQTQDTGEVNEKSNGEEREQGRNMSSGQKIAELREEEEESTQDLLTEAQGRRIEDVDMELGWGSAVQESGEERGQELGQDQGQPQEREAPLEPELVLVAKDSPKAPHPDTVDNEPQLEEHMAHRPSSRASSNSKLKADSNRPTVHEELDLVLPATASTHHDTPESSQESSLKDGPEHHEAAMALLNVKSLEIESLHALLTKEREDRQGLAQEKADWVVERSVLVASIEELKRSIQSAQSDRDFFREQYGQASAFVSSVRKENVELEERTRTAEEQAKIGVEMVKATFVQRVQWLEDDARTWRTTAQYLIEMDKRTKGEELRKRAAEAPELLKKCDDLEEKNEVLCERLEELEEELDRKVQEEAKRMSEEQAKMEDEMLRQAELENWRNETLRLNLALNEVKTELDMLKADAGIGKATDAQGSLSDHEMVYRCQWRTEGSNDACEGLFLSVEELQNHLFSGGHLHR